jgi:hypothetical protein
MLMHNSFQAKEDKLVHQGHQELMELKAKLVRQGHRGYQVRMAFRDLLDLKACLAKQPP